MKLVDLDPAWTAIGRGRQGMGLSFHCPRCYLVCGPAAHRVSVAFINPVDAHSPYPTGPYHERKGTDFTTLTILPSIEDRDSHHWSGHVLNGDIVDDARA